MFVESILPKPISYQVVQRLRVGQWDVVAMREYNNNDQAPEERLSPLPGAQGDPTQDPTLEHISGLPDFQQQTAYPRSPSKECRDELSVSHKVLKGADVGGIILLGEQLGNESTSSTIILPSSGGGGGVTNGDEGDAQMCNGTDNVPEERAGTGVSGNISGSERMGLMTMSSPASETDAANLE